MVLSTTRDRPLDWLRAGQALQHALLTATHNGVSASFLTQPLELHDAQSLRGGPPESPESPGPGARPRPLEPLGRKADSDLQPLPGGGCDSDRRRLPWRWPYAEYPQMVLRVGYAAHERGHHGSSGPRRPRLPHRALDAALPPHPRRRIAQIIGPQPDVA